MDQYTGIQVKQELKTLNQTLNLILEELRKSNKPVVVKQRFVGPHSNAQNCGDGTGCKCGTE